MKHTARVPVFPKALGLQQQYTHVTTIGNRVFARARESDGTPVYVESAYAPTYYLPDPTSIKHKAIDGTPLTAVLRKDINAGRDFLEKYAGQVYGDIGTEYMLLSDVYGATPVPWELERLYIWNIDIEVDKDPLRGYASVDDPFNPVNAITVIWRHLGQKGVVVYGVPWNKAIFNAPADVLYIECDTEEELLLRFLDDFRAGGDYPDIVTGWNVQFYDIPYLVNRLKLLFTEETWIRLAPFTRLAERKLFIQGRQQTVMDIKGLAILDYYELYRKFTLVQQENYRLDHIAHVELKKRKISYAEFRGLHELYRKDYQKFIEYNIQDVRLVDELDDKMKLIELVCALTYGAKCNFADTFKQVRLWDIMIYHKLRELDCQIPPRKDESKAGQYEGAYVKDPIVGMHEWVVSFDVASMYPHIIREWNLSPETIQPERIDLGMLEVNGETQHNVDDLLARTIDTDEFKQQGLALAANGVLTNHQEGFLPNMMKTLYEERIRYKKLMQKAEQALEAETDEGRKKLLRKEISSCNNQQAIRKVNLNSAYGALGSAYFRFYDVDLAEAVTVTGKLAIRWIAKDINLYLNKVFKTNDDYIIASDTDSVYIKMARVAALIVAANPTATRPEIVAAMNDFSNQKIQPIIDRALASLAEYLNVANPCMSMVRDVIADKGVWTAKKRYILNMWDKEGTRYEKPKMKIMGIEAIKSSTPAICRDWIKTGLQLLMTGTQDELWLFIEKCRDEFGKAPFEDVAFPRSCNNIAEYLDKVKSVPIHVRGALAFNRTLEAMDLLTSYEPIAEGEKIKFAYLREPNKYQSYVLSAPGGCPPEWQVEKEIDYNTQFEKAFVGPLQAILACAGWSTEFEASLY